MMVYYGYDVGLLERVPKRNWNSPTKLGAVEVRPPPQVGIEPLVNHRKTIGKPWENHRKTIGKWWFNGI